MDSYSLLNDMLAALAADTELTALSTAWYGRAPEVFIDHDPNNPPGGSSAPAIQLHSPAWRGAEDSREVLDEFVVPIDIDDANDETRPEPNTNEFTATARLDALARRAIAVIRAAKPSEAVMGVEYVTDTVNSFPMFTADILITLTQQLFVGQDPLA